MPSEPGRKMRSATGGAEGARSSPLRTGMWGGLLSGVLAAGVGAVLDYTAIRRSTISTAAVGLIFELPIVALLWGIQGGLIGFCAGYLLAARRSARGWRETGRVVAGLVLLTVGGRLTLEVVTGLVVGAEVRQVGRMDEPQLRGVLDSRLFGRNLFVLAAVAGNERTSAETLRQIASRPDPELHRKLGSIYDVMGTNTHGLAVMRRVARNPHVDGETLEILSRSPDPYVLGDVAMNSKLPEEALARLLGREERMVSWGVALNPKTPPWALSRLSGNPDEYVRSNVARNPSSPPDELRQLARDPAWHVRRDVATNPKTPPDILELLRRDPDERVRGVAASAPTHWAVPFRSEQGR